MNSTRTMNFNHIWLVRSINEGTMKQIQLFDYYVLGKAIEPLFQVKEESLVNDAGFDALAACRQLKEVTRKDSVFLSGTRRAAESLMRILIEQLGDGIQDGFPVFWDEESDERLGRKAQLILVAATDFETVFKNDTPSMTVFWAQQKGIYRTEDLIDHAEMHLPDSVMGYLSAQAKIDLKAAGRCLAFNLPTATAFHVWRALEVTFGEYYVALSGKSFETAKIARNWGAYIKALNDAGADAKITGNLDHIRAVYRNPVMHPNVNVQPEEAFGLVGIGFSAMTQVLNEIARIMSSPKTP
jgi:hypothetical protein